MHSSNSGAQGVLALFQDSTANALSAVNGLSLQQFHIVHEMAAGTTSETTFKLRLGPSAAVTLYVNAVFGGATIGFGGVAATNLTIMEYTPAD